MLFSHDHLNNGSPAWSETAVRISQSLAPRRLVDVAVTTTERFDLRDRQIGAAYVAPLSGALTATLEANASSTHRVLARNAFGATLQYEFAPAWLLHAGARTTSYDTVRVNQSLLMLEHYFSDFSWALAWRPARAFDTTAHSAEIRASYYYGDKSSVGIIVAGGKEAASIGSVVTLTDLRSGALVGRHWLNRDWALNYALGSTRQGNFYVRNGISLGVQYAF
jgi:YaiO family outer membrane protein